MYSAKYERQYQEQSIWGCESVRAYRWSSALSASNFRAGFRVVKCACSDPRWEGSYTLASTDMELWEKGPLKALWTESFGGGKKIIFKIKV
jgi:hypothetical protein